MGAFFVCSGLTSVTIPTSVTYIGILSYKLFSVTNESTSLLGNVAFGYCTGLTSVTILGTISTGITNNNRLQ